MRRPRSVSACASLVSLVVTVLSTANVGVAFTTPKSSFRTCNSRKVSESAFATSTARKAVPLITEASDLYSYALSNYQLPTQCATGGFLCGIGDLVAQKSEQIRQQATKQAAHDIARTRHFVLKGLGGAIIWSTWYKIADGLAANICHDLSQYAEWVSTPEFEGVVRTISCIGLEQFIACPIIFALWEIPVPKLLGGATPIEIPSEIRNRLPPLLVDNAKLWTFFNMVIYNVPLEFRVAASNLCDIVWQVVLSKSLAKDDTGTGGTIEQRA